MRHPGFHLLLMVVIGILLLCLFETTSWDITIANLFTDPQTHRFIYRDNALLTTYFHKALRTINALLGLIAATWCIRQVFTSIAIDDKIAWATAASSLLTISLVVGILKSITNRYCPWSFDIFGGDIPYTRLLEALPSIYRQSNDGQCFPAGHASGGFMWLSFALAFWWQKPRLARWGLWLGLIMGSVMGGTQMIRGAHFLSHTLWTVVVAWSVTACWWWWWSKIGKSYWKTPN